MLLVFCICGREFLEAPTVEQNRCSPRVLLFTEDPSLSGFETLNRSTCGEGFCSYPGIPPVLAGTHSGHAPEMCQYFS